MQWVNVLIGKTRSKATEAGSVKSALDLIGKTPLLELTDQDGAARVYAKAEFQNPSGSIKDRIVAYILQEAEQRGKLAPGQTIVEATSGNTGVSLALVAAIKGYKALIVAPDSTSSIKKHMMKLYGAELSLTDGEEGIKATVEKARILAEERDAFLLDQFRSPDNPAAHHVTGKEILDQLGAVDVFVAGVGTGGTLIGVGEVLKEVNPSTRLVAVEPYTAPALFNLFYGEDLSIGSGIPHRIEGIGETFVSDILEKRINLIDDVVLVKDEEAFHCMRQLGQNYGLCVGVSSGANVHVAKSLARSLDYGMSVVTVLPDSGQRYLDRIEFTD